MLIQWYPGHMTKAMRMMEDNVKLVDSVIYVLDSRAVLASFNPSFFKLVGNKPVLYVLNKADMVKKDELKLWVNRLTYEGKTVITANSASGNCSKIVEKLRELNKDLLERYKAKGANRSIRAMVIGIPNSGKSTMVNSLCGAKRAITGDRPGVTRGKQWVSLGTGVELLDTPGTLWPSFENQNHALHLAFLGSIKEDVLNIEELAFELVKFLKQNYPKALQDRYKLKEICDDDLRLYEDIAKSRGFVLRGGVYDYERLARAVIDDFKKQKFGLLMLEQSNEE